MSTHDTPSPTAEQTRDDDLQVSRAPSCVVVRYERERRLIDVRDHPEVVIGRSRNATYFVDDDRVSRRHLRITFRQGTLYAEDLGSRNGSKLNGRRIEGRVALQPGDLLSAGPVEVGVVHHQRGHAARRRGRAVVAPRGRGRARGALQAAAGAWSA